MLHSTSVTARASSRRFQREAGKTIAYTVSGSAELVFYCKPSFFSCSFLEESTYSFLWLAPLLVAGTAVVGLVVRQYHRAQSPFT